MGNPLDNLGAAGVGMYAVVKICRHNGIDPHELCDFVLKEIFSVTIECEHDQSKVSADILEGDWPFHAVQWCQVCGAYRHGFDLEPCTGQPQRFGEWHEPEKS